MSRREQMQQVAPLFDHLGGASEHGRRNIEAKGFGGLEVDDKFVLRMLSS
jgi:hypothetical protein